MQFLNPGFLWALTAVAIPIIVHLFNFRKYTTIYFSHLNFLQQVKKDTRSKSNLKNLLLLLIRIASIVLLVLAFSRPYIDKNPEKRTTKIPYVAIYIDNSFSMEAEGSQGILLEEAKMKTLQIMDAFPIHTNYLLITNSIASSQYNWISHDQMIDKVSQITSTHLPKNAQQVYEQIYRLLPQSDTALNLNIFLVSDFQLPFVEQPLQQKNTTGKHYALLLHNPKTGNISIDSVWCETPGHYPGKKEILNVKIKNFASETYRNLPIQLHINDSLKTSLVITLEKESEKIVQIPYLESDTGMMHMKVSLNDYPITFDNTFYFNYTINQKNKVLVIQGKNAHRYFTTLFADDDLFTLHEVSIFDIPYNEFNQYQTIFLNSIEDYSSGTLFELKQYIEKGGSLVYLPPQKEKLADINLFLAKISSLRFGEWQTQEGTIVNLDEKHPLFREVFKRSPKESKMPSYQGFYSLYPVKPEKLEVLFYSESEADLFVKEPINEGVLYVSAIPFEPNVTDFGTHPIFVPLFYNIALQSSANQQLYYPLTTNVAAKINFQEYRGQSVVLESLESEREQMPKTRYQNGLMYLYPEPEKLKAGCFKVKIEDHPIDLLSFNYNREESVTKYLTEEQLKEWYKNGGLFNISVLKIENQSLSSQLKKLDSKPDLTQWMLLGLVLFLIMELIVIRWKN